MRVLLWRIAMPRFIAYPEPGFFKLRLVKGGPWVPAVLFLPCPWVPPLGAQEVELGAPGPDEWCRPIERSRQLLALIGNRPGDVDKVWTWGERIGANEYAWRMKLADWATSAGAPEATPRQPVRLGKIESIF